MASCLKARGHQLMEHHMYVTSTKVMEPDTNPHLVDSKPNTLCLTLTLTVHYLALLMERERIHIGPVLPSCSSSHFLLMTIPTPYLSAPFPPSLQSSPSPQFLLSLHLLCFSHSLVSFLVLHVPKPILCTGHAKLNEIHTPSLKISPFDWGTKIQHVTEESQSRVLRGLTEEITTWKAMKSSIYVCI